MGDRQSLAQQVGDWFKGKVIRQPYKDGFVSLVNLEDAIGACFHMTATEHHINRIDELIQEYRIVVRPSLVYGGNLRFCAAMLRRVYLSGDRWDVWHQTYCEADNLEAVVNACAEKCKAFIESGEHGRALEL